MFTQIWHSVSLNDARRGHAADAAGAAPIAHHADSRQAFLLLSLEGLSEADVGFVLDPREPARQLADQAGRELAAEIATDVLIIEDETFIAMDLESLVRNLGHRVIGVARTHSDAVALGGSRPGLILADIQLADGSSGLEAVNEMLKSFEVPVVFITAYPERFLTGERPEPAFLISKPFQPAMVSAVVSQALKRPVLGVRMNKDTLRELADDVGKEAPALIASMPASALQRRAAFGIVIFVGRIRYSFAVCAYSRP